MLLMAAADISDDFKATTLKFVVANRCSPGDYIGIMPPLGNSLDEAWQVRKCQDGEPMALAELRARCHQPLLNILLARGASRTEAEDLLADLWADCVPGP